MIRKFLFLLVCGLSLTGFASGQDVTFESLLDEIVDRDQLAQTPSPEYLCAQASSYDRDSVSPENQETWYANWDRSQFVRTEEIEGKKHYVLMDEAGPGAVVRFWGTWHGPSGQQFSDGTLNIYLDGSKLPAISGPITEILSGKKLVGAPLSEGVSPLTNDARQGHNLYLPIPYNKHCKITYTTDVLVDQGGKKGEALYYQINYRTYAAGTNVQTFSESLLSESAEKLESVRAALEKGKAPVGGELIDLAAAEVSGSTRTLQINGSQAINRITIKPDLEGLTKEAQSQLLRSTILQIEFDGETCVWCPVGDFFGSGYQISPAKTWYTSVEQDGTMSCYWTMPFGQSAKVSLVTLTGDPMKLLTGEVAVSPWTWNDRSMHFHSGWNQLYKVDTRGNKKMDGVGAFDVNYVTLEGEGVFVGDTLTLFNGTSAWWGEGDEKIYVDGESFPSHFGTGTEDYYGYAWCRPEKFQSAFHSQPCGDGNLTIGYSVNSRYRALDAIPYKQSLKFDMELWHWQGTKMNYAPTVFWYAKPGGKSNLAQNEDQATQKVAITMDDIIQVPRVEGAIEGETFQVIAKSAGTTEIQQIPAFGWSGTRQLWWRDATPGSTLELAFNAPENGKFKVLVNLTQAPDYGIVAFNVNGTDIDEEFDRFIPSGVQNSRVDLGELEIRKGENRMTVKVTGTNDAAQKRYMFGLDYILLEK